MTNQCAPSLLTIDPSPLTKSARRSPAPGRAHFVQYALYRKLLTNDLGLGCRDLDGCPGQRPGSSNLVE